MATNVGTVQGILRLVDQFTPVLAKAADRARTASDQMASSVNGASDQASQATSRLSDAANDMSVALAGAAGGAGASFVRMGASISAGAGVAGLAATGLIFTLQQLVDVLLEVVKATTPVGVQMEGIEQRLKFATGSAEEGAKAFDFLLQTAQALGIDFESLIDSFSNFAAAAQTSNLTLKQQQAIFFAVAESVAVLRLNADQTRFVFLALEQMISRGFVSMEELRRQLGNRLPGAFGVAEKALDGLVDNLAEAVSSGKILSEEFLPNFAQEMHKAFGEAVPDAADSAFAAMNRFNTNIFLLKAAIAREFLPSLADLIEHVAMLVVVLGQAAEAIKLGGVLSFLINRLSDLALTVAAAPPLFKALGAAAKEAFADILTSLASVTRGFAALVASIPGIGEAMAKSFEDAAGRLDVLSVQLQIAAQRDFDAIIRRIVELGGADKQSRIEALASIMQELERVTQLTGFGAEEASKKTSQYESALEGLRKKLFPITEQIRQLNEEMLLLTQAFQKGDVTGKEFADGIDQLKEEMVKLAVEGEDAAEAIDLTVKPEAIERAEMLDAAYADTVDTLNRLEDVALGAFAEFFPDEAKVMQLEQAAMAVELFGRSAGLSADQVERLGIAIEGAIFKLENPQIAETERQLTQMFETVAFGFEDALFAAITGQGDAIDILMRAIQNALFDIIDNFIRQFARAMAEQIAAQQAAAAATGAAAGAAQGGGQAAAGAAGGAGAAGAGAAAALAAGFVIIIIDKLADMLSDSVTFDAVDLAIDKFGARLAQGLEIEIINRGEFLSFEGLGDELEQNLGELSKNEKLIVDAFTEIFSSLLATTGAIIGEGVEPFLFGIAQKWEDGQFIAARVIIDGVTRSFETLEEAIGIVMQEFLQHSIEQGVVFDEAVQQLAMGFQGDPRQFGDAVARVQSLADASLMALDGFSAMEIEMMKLPATLNALRGELQALGLSADQVTRLVGGQLVQSFQAWRQQITGEELSVEQRRKIAEAQAQLFNAELELQIARLEAEKAALLAEAGIAQSEVQLHGNVIQAQGRFVNAKAGLANAELGIMQGFVSGAGAIIRSGVELIGDTSRVLGDVLGSLPEEIRKQVEAIQKVIDALKAIGTISPGDIRIPGASGGVGGIGGGGPSGPSADDAIGRLIDAIMQSVRTQQDLVDTLRESLGGLETFIRDLRLGAPSPLTPGRQVEILRKQLSAAAEAARTGDLDQIQEFQRIAQQIRTIGAEAFGTAGSGFEALLREIERLGTGVLDEGNEVLESQEDILSDLRSEFADLLELANGLHDLSQEEIRAIREGTDSNTGGNLSIFRELGNQGGLTRRELRDLREELARQGRVIADFLARVA